MAQKIVIGSDHAGFPMKGFLIGKLQEAGYEVEDMGTHSEASCNAAPIARAVAEAVANAEAKDEVRGILICGTGIAMSMMANKVKGAYAALVHDLFTARMTRQHNDSNVLCMGQRIIANQMAWEIAQVWLGTEALGGKYAERRDWIRGYEEAHFKM